MKLIRIVAISVILAAFLLSGCTSNTPLENAAVGTSAAGVPTTAPALTEAMEVPNDEILPFTVKITPVITETQKQVTVITADEFLAAIAPNTEIIVDAALIDLSKAAGYGEHGGDYYCWEQTHDGPELYITEVSNLTIRGSGENHDANIISSVPRYSNVLNFLNCSNIVIQNLTAGHTEEEGECTGGVLYFLNSQNILVENCGLFGCGTVGVAGMNSKDIQIINNDIYDCSIGGVDLSFCDNVNADGNTFRDLGIFTFRVYDCGSVICNGEPVFDSYHGN